MQILVIGGTGFIGPHVVGGLVERGHQVTVFHRGETHADLAAGWSGQVITVPREQSPEHLRENADWNYHWFVDTGRIGNRG